MPELGLYGSMRGARGNSRPYRDHCVGWALNGSVAIDPLRTRTTCEKDLVGLNRLQQERYSQETYRSMERP